MTVEEKRKKVSEYCDGISYIKCENGECALNGSHISSDVDCIGIGYANEEQLDRALALISVEESAQSHTEAVGMDSRNCLNCKYVDRGADPCNNCNDYNLYEKDNTVTDNVNHPDHYQGAHECIDVMVAMFGVEDVKGFCRCNAYKYRFRADSKGSHDEDIKKAEWYEGKLIELLSEVSE